MIVEDTRGLISHRDDENMIKEGNGGITGIRTGSESKIVIAKAFCATNVHYSCND